MVLGEAPPTVFLNVFDSDSITIGMNEDPEQVLDLAFCRARGVDFRRRINGGGPIYAGAGSAFLIYFLPVSHPEVPATTEEAFRKILSAVADVFRDRYGFPAEYRPLNDIQVEGRKLVPTSLKIEDGAMTLRIVVNVKPIDTELAGKAMPMPPEKVRDKALKTLESRFTWLEREAVREIDEAELTAFAIACTERAFGESELERAPLGAVERRYADAFRAELDTDAWLFGKSERIRFADTLRPGDMLGRGREKAMGGMIRATLLVPGRDRSACNRQRRLAPAPAGVRRLAGACARRRDCPGGLLEAHGGGLPRQGRCRVRRHRGRRADDGVRGGTRRLQTLEGRALSPDDLPADRGAYALVLRLARGTRLDIATLGRPVLPAGSTSTRAARGGPAVSAPGPAAICDVPRRGSGTSTI